MKRINTSVRISLSLAIFSLNILMIAWWLGLFPDKREYVIQQRTALCNAIAVNCSSLATAGEFNGVQQLLRQAVNKNEDLNSAALRRHNGQIQLQVGAHSQYWKLKPGEGANPQNIPVPIMSGDADWGVVEMSFKPLHNAWLAWLPAPEFTHFLVFMVACNALVFIFYLRKVLTHLDPSRVVPDRVRSALDTLAEGLVVLDKSGRIAMANQAFADKMGIEAESLQGRKASDLPWVKENAADNFPWVDAIAHNATQTSVPLNLASTRGDEERNLRVNAAPILDDKGNNRGALVSFDDVTVLESKKAELVTMLDALKESREEIKEQNAQLKILATMDPLTGCMNRRSFFELYDEAWANAQRDGTPLCGIMVDIDHFKSVNDNYGHAVGDDVLRGVAKCMRETAREGDLPARFGGEEFSIVLPNTDLDTGVELAEKIRIAISKLVFGELQVTASLGISSIALKADDPQALLEQADKCLYVAKRNGRNQVVRFDEVPEDIEVDESQISRTKEEEAEKGETNADPVSKEQAIPFHAVTALLSALSYRDSDTASHSTRVADICVEFARGVLSVKDTYVLEIAALLHDIGKIGVPDAVLKKPSSLDDSEWQAMRLHDRVGVEIVKTSFASPMLEEIIRCHHAHFGGNPNSPDLPSGNQIPVGARILAIADAYDSIISDTVYRPARSKEEAFLELQRCSGTQFDPALVERFISVMQWHEDHSSQDVHKTSKQTALQIGLQIEQLAQAIDDKDINGLAMLADNLERTAEQNGITRIQSVASELKALAGKDDELEPLIQMTHELLDLCRATQRSFIDYESQSTEPAKDPFDEAMAQPIGRGTVVLDESPDLRNMKF